MTPDAIVVGSGPAGANAAAALVGAGRRVLMLDVGDRDERYAPLIPPHSFREIRETEPQQHRFFLGDDFEGVPAGKVGTGAQLMPPRLHVTAQARALLPIVADGFTAAESLALGGLGAAWGAGVFAFDDRELAEWPISRADLQPHYDAVARRIGVSAAADDVARFYGPLRDAMPPLELDSNAESVLSAYDRRRGELNADGFWLGRPPLAVCTREHHGRGPQAYRDMDFWSDGDRSVYRPRWTIEALRAEARDRFQYEPGVLVQRFEQLENGVRIVGRRLADGSDATFGAPALLLGAGTLGTARIVLRSLGMQGERVPLLCNPYTYAPVINWAMLGREARDRRHSLAQLSAFYQPEPSKGGRGAVQTQLFSYRSLLTFRLMKEAPIAHRESRRVMQLLMSAFGILGINHDDRPSRSKYVMLRSDDRLEVHFALSGDEQAQIDANERAVLRCFRALGCWAIKRVRPGIGSSIHYAGTFPFGGRSAVGGDRWAVGGVRGVDSEGLLDGTRSVYLIDGSVFPYLPAKGLTFTIMANADRVATRLAQRLAS